MTLVVATEGELKLPAVNSTADLREALAKLGSVPADQIQVKTTESGVRLLNSECYHPVAVFFPYSTMRGARLPVWKLGTGL